MSFVRNASATIRLTHLPVSEKEIHIDPFRRLNVDALLFCGQNRKLLVVLCDEPGQDIVGAVNIRDAKESQLTGQSVLHGVPPPWGTAANVLRVPSPRA